MLGPGILVRISISAQSAILGTVLCNDDVIEWYSELHNLEFITGFKKKDTSNRYN